MSAVLLLSFVILFVIGVLSDTPRDCAPTGAFPGTTPDAFPFIEFAMAQGFGVIDGREAPMDARNAMSIGNVQWDCAAAFDSNKAWKRLRSKDRPNWWDNKIPDELRTRDNKALCYVYGLLPLLRYLDILNVSTGPEGYNQDYIAFYELWGLTNYTKIAEMEDDARECVRTSNNEDYLQPGCAKMVAKKWGYCPDVLGVLTGVNVVEILRDDGWNEEGKETPFGKCSANCRPFSDPIGIYDPRTNKNKIRLKNAGKLLDQNGFTDANEFPWVKLQEDNSLGFFVRQEHITPHIGFNTKSITTSTNDWHAKDARIGPPNYDFNIEAPKVVEEVRLTAENDTRKFIIEIMDDKIGLAALLQRNHITFFGGTYEQTVIHETGNRIAEYEGILYAWRAKIMYNRVRPTTVVQSGEYTTKRIFTWGGPFEGEKRIKSRDFQPFIRVMPHSEFPSGSTCICRMILDFEDKFIPDQYPVLSTFFGGSYPVFALKRIGLFPPSSSEPGGDHESLTFLFQNIREVYDGCSQSRLWGGQHFEKAINAGDALCDRTSPGDGIYEFLQSLNFDNGVDPNATSGPPPGPPGGPPARRLVVPDMDAAKQIFDDLDLEYQRAVDIAKGGSATSAKYVHPNHNIPKTEPKVNVEPIKNNNNNNNNDDVVNDDNYKKVNNELKSLENSFKNKYAFSGKELIILFIIWSTVILSMVFCGVCIITRKMKSSKKGYEQISFKSSTDTDLSTDVDNDVIKHV